MKLALLRWTLALALGAPAIGLVLTSRHRPLQALGLLEALGAVLLMAPPARKWGAALLLLSLFIAAGFHALSGEWPPAAFLVYAAATLLVAEP